MSGFTAGTGAVLAHGGGLPEAAALAAPLIALVIFVLLERRACRREREDQDVADE